MKTYTPTPRALPLDDSWDVIVAGGGPAGCAAAAAAARQGARTLLLEATGSLGGMGTSGLVPAWCPFTDKRRIVYGGMAETVLRKCMAEMPHVAPDQLDWTPIDAEPLKRIYDELVLGSGAEVLFNVFLAGVERAGGSRDVDVLLVAGKFGLRAFRAKVYVDATGDADLAAWAGAEFEKGDGGDGALQPATHCFVISNVDMYAYRHCGGVRYSPHGECIRDIVASGKYPDIPDIHACNNVVGPGAIGFNAGHIWDVDNTDPYSVSRGLVKGRRIAKAFRDALAEFFPSAFANGYLAKTAPLLGVRESRRIVGDYVLTTEDYLARRSFPDEICRNSYYLDVHGTRTSESAGDAAKESRTHRYGPGESHGVPYRCLTPRGLRNVLVAGRSISTDRAVQGSTRVMPVCLCMGEAAGIAAAMASAGDHDVHAVSVEELRATLRAHGAYLP